MSAGQVLQHRYTPRGASRELFSVRDGEVLVSGPAGTGKSRGCLEKIFRICLQTPQVRGLIARKTATSLTSTALVTFREHVAKEALEVGDVWWYGGSAEQAAGYRFANGSFIAVGGLDKPEKIMSSEYDVAYVQEATELTVDDWEAITSRLRNGRLTFQQLMADCNPSHPKHWLKQRADRGVTRLLYSTHEENPRYFDEVTREDGSLGYVMTGAGRSYVEGKLDQLTGVRKERLRYGRWAAAEGVIFENWRDELHLVDRYPVPDSWTRYWVVDFGFTHPFVLQCWAEDPDGRLVLYREIFHTKRMVEEHAKQILREVTRPTVSEDRLDKGELGPLDDVNRGWRVWTEPKPYMLICDHDAEGRATLEKYLGMGSYPARKTVTEGIERVNARLLPAGDGQPRLTIMRDSLVELDDELAEAKQPTCTAEEIPGYIWKPDPTGGTRKEEPLKLRDDGCDALRYVVAELDLGPGAPNWRVLS